ncbi:MAG: hypothetical protein WCJ33_00810 [Pseudomonadota bacterium]
MTHNVHFLLIRANSAKEAACVADLNTREWGDKRNNYSRIGGIASQDGSNDIQNYDDGGWALAFLDSEDIPQNGNYYSKAATYINKLSAGNTINSNLPEHLTDFKTGIHNLREQLTHFNPDCYNGDELGTLRVHLKHLYDVIGSNPALKTDLQIPELHAWNFIEEGCTDMTHLSLGKKRYIAILDMHS